MIWTSLEKLKGLSIQIIRTQHLNDEEKEYLIKLRNIATFCINMVNNLDLQTKLHKKLTQPLTFPSTRAQCCFIRKKEVQRHIS